MWELWIGLLQTVYLKNLLELMQLFIKAENTLTRIYFESRA